MKITWETIENLVKVKNQGNGNVDLVVEKVGKKIRVYNNKTGLDSEYDNVVEAYTDLYYDLV
jgi:hypothetical protein